MLEALLLGVVLTINFTYGLQDQPEKSPEDCLAPKINDVGMAILGVFFYYDQETGTCTGFNYGGGGNSTNVFSSLQKCEKVCQPYLRDREPRNKKDCLKESGISSGPANIPRYSFDQTEQDCKEINWKGIGIIEKNNFPSMKACKRVCDDYIHDRRDEKNNCFKDSGEIVTTEKRYRYNLTTRKCQGYYPAGKRNGPNSFRTLKECENLCVRIPGAEREESAKQLYWAFRNKYGR